MLGDSWYFLTPYSLPLITLPNVCIKLCSFESHANQLNPLSPCCCCCLLETGGKGARHNLGKHDIAQGHSINWLESNGSKMTSQLQPDLDCQYMLTVTDQQAKWYTQRCHDSSKTDHQRSESLLWLNSWKSPPLPENVWKNPPTH